MGPHGGFKLIVEADNEIVNYLYALIPPYISRHRQKYPAHISVVRKEIPPRTELWGKHEGREISFAYTHQLFKSDFYFWVNVYSIELEQIREELGLGVSSRYYEPPPGFRQTFHMTIANSKGL